MWHTYSEIQEIIAGAFKKLEDGEKLKEDELRVLACEVEFSKSDEFEQVAELDGNDHRWQREVSTIVKAHGRYWRIDWMKALTETSEDSFWDQPVEVRPVTRIIPAREVTEYVQIEDAE